MAQDGTAISAILSQLGWDETLAIPVANNENKQLMALVELKMKQNRQNQNDNTTYEEKIQAISNHMQNVRQELQHTESLMNAKMRESETESHITKVGERENGRLNQEIIRLTKSMKDIIQKKNVYEANIFTKTSQLDNLKAQMDWDQQALEAWLEESEKHSEDTHALERYAKQDESKLRELNLQLEHLTEESNKKRRKLDCEIIDVQTTQVELDKTAEEFRKAHQERQNLIQQWENTIGQLKRRDHEIDLLAQQMSNVKQEIRDKEESLKEKKQFYTNQKENNTEMEKKIGFADRNAAKLRQDGQDSKEQNKRFIDELAALKRTVDRTAGDLEKVRSQITFLKKDKVLKSQRLEEAKKQRDELQIKLARVLDSKMTAEERATAADKEMAEEDALQRKRETQLKQMREAQFKKAQELQDVKNDLRQTEATIDGNRAALRNLVSKMSKLDTAILKQQEILYNQDFSVQTLERRLNRMQGERSEDEKILLEKKITELSKELDDQSQTAIILTNQLKTLQHDVRRCKRDMEKVSHEKEDLTSKIEELELHTETAQRELKKRRVAKENLLVEDNIMKLEIKRLRELLYNKADTCVTLERKRLQLETAIQERRQEIIIHQDMLRLELRGLDEERQKISSELQARISKIDKLQNRYDILMVSMRPPEGEEEKSQAYYVIKAAQDKEELQRQGDELDAKIRKAEKEIRALENTLVLMNSCNETYRKSFVKVTESSDELMEKSQLDEQLRAVMDKLKMKRRLLREFMDDEEMMRSTLNNYLRDEAVYLEQESGVRQQLIGKEKELKEIQEKLARAEGIIQKTRRTLQSKGKSFDDDESDISVRDRLELNRGLINELYYAVSQKSPSLATRVRECLEQSGLPLPDRSGPASIGSSISSVASSRIGTTRSSVASSRRSSAGVEPPITNKLTIDGEAVLGSGRSSVSSSRTSQQGSARGRSTPK